MEFIQIPDLNRREIFRNADSFFAFEVAVNYFSIITHNKWAG